MGSWPAVVLTSVLLILGTAFFVAAEYALVASRRTKLDSLSRKGNKAAEGALRTMDNPAGFIAVGQIGISALGIGLGTFTEPFLTAAIERAIGGQVPKALGHLISIIIVTYVVVVIGELSPKYLALRAAERVLLSVYRPMNFLAWLTRPLIWLIHQTTSWILRPFGIRLDEPTQSGIPKDELLVLVRTGSAEGLIPKEHAEFVARALKIDMLTARDIMVHRLDIKWIDVGVNRDQLLERLQAIPYGRIPICKGDIDDVLGVIYLHDVVKNLGAPEINLEQILRPAVTIPENLTIDRIVATMRDQKTQILLVLDEYGGTSGLVTLEDVVEEVFGELQDRLESERSPVERLRGGRISARAEVRLDELLDWLGIELQADDPTATLAEIIVEKLGRVPRPGDSVVHPLGVLRVENMARRRITRVSVQLSEEIATI